MGLFKRSRPSHVKLPVDVAETMAQWGRFQYDPQEVHADFGALEYEMWQLAQQDEPRFIAALADAVMPVGDWSVFGASRMIMSVADPESDDVRYRELLAESVRFLARMGASPLNLNSYEIRALNEQVGE